MVAVHPPFSVESKILGAHYTKFRGRVNSNYWPISQPISGPEVKKIGLNQLNAKGLQPPYNQTGNQKAGNDR